jgi:hypothetical protein
VAILVFVLPRKRIAIAHTSWPRHLHRAAAAAAVVVVVAGSAVTDDPQERVQFVMCRY